MKTPYRLILVVALLLLSACGVETNPPRVQNHLNQGRTLKQPSYLVEFNRFPRKEVILVHVGSMKQLPSVTQYKKDSSYWKQWQVAKKHVGVLFTDNKYRIIDFVPAGTHYEITEIRIPRSQSEANGAVIGMITSGRHKGTVAKLGFISYIDFECQNPKKYEVAACERIKSLNSAQPNHNGQIITR